MSPMHKKHTLLPDGRNLLWEAMEPRLRSAGRAFTAGTLSYKDYLAAVKTIRVALDV